MGTIQFPGLRHFREAFMLRLALGVWGCARYDAKLKQNLIFSF